MDNQHVSRYRSEVIEKTINLEWLINVVICQHYFKRIDSQFILEVLYYEYFSLGLKRRILEKIIDDPPPKTFNNLNRILRIRNLFAHCGQEIIEGSDPTLVKGKVIDPRHLNRALDFDKLFHEFGELLLPMKLYLVRAYIGKGGKLSIIKNGEFINADLPASE